MTPPPFHGPLAAVSILVLSGLASYGLVALLFPLMRRYAMARPNARSSHRVPTPQGGGIAVVGAVVIVVGLFVAAAPASLLGERLGSLLLVLAATVALAVLGALDDILELPVLVRLVVQGASALALLLALGEGVRVLPDWLPWLIEAAILILGTVWFVNLTNFMDGIDGITVAEAVPVALAAGALLWFAEGAESLDAVVIALALAGGLLGFLPYNRHPARLFLGDVGSLAIGFLIAYLLVRLAAAGHLAAALILPLYYLLDATGTLLRRLVAGKRVWQAHRDHAYQRALDAGRMTVPEITLRLWLVNLLLAVLAGASVVAPGPVVQILALTLALLVTLGYLGLLEGSGRR
ncbi:MAG: glycosyl transferase [Rhizobiales bacterium]|nr:glycosyl transferase [Hyphomicrobiales bacterium]